MRSLCVIEGCDSPVAGRGWCRMHYMRWRRWGDPLEPDHRSLRPRTLCAEDGCDKPVRSGGLCSTHQARVVRKADPRVGPFERICGWCGAEFLSRYATRATFCSRKCKEQHRNSTPEHRAETSRHYYARRYGLTPDQAAELRKDGCAICGRTDVPGRWENNLHIDHDHATGKIRGVLCHGCNVAIGHFRDDPELLRKAIAYLS